jgi:hypothetical protein
VRRDLTGAPTTPYEPDPTEGLRTIAGYVRVSNQMLTGDYSGGPPLRQRVRARLWLRRRVSSARERVALWICPWLWDGDDW